MHGMKTIDGNVDTNTKLSRSTSPKFEKRATGQIQSSRMFKQHLRMPAAMQDYCATTMASTLC